MKQAHINISTEISCSDVSNRSRSSISAHTYNSDQIRVSHLDAHNVAINISSYDANQYTSLAVFIKKDMVKQLVYDLMKTEQAMEDEK